MLAELKDLVDKGLFSQVRRQACVEAAALKQP